MKKALIFILIVTGFISCNQKDKFKIDGSIENAADQTLYLEHNGLSKTTVLDSTKLSKDGDFKFKSPRPKYPDLYRLRLNSKVITFAVDSNEHININAKNENFANEYSITGSTTSSDIKKLRNSVLLIEQGISEFSKISDDNIRAQKAEVIKAQIESHKEMAKKLIISNPRSLAAYFAIYQQINNTFLFSPYAKEDRPFCAAVATSFNTFMPDYERTINTYNLVMDAIKADRAQKSKQDWDKLLEEQGKGYIDIVLNDKNNQEKRLSQFEGKVILIDFSAYENKESVDYTFALRELYNKYSGRGFEIYQVSLDRNKLIWEQAIENIPWVCVRDEDGPNTRYISTFNISSLPTTFLMNRKGDIIARNLSFSELKKAIEKSL